MLADLAIFPLSTVLFPGGVLPLRVFETRYMDMVRDCLQHDRPFGVCLITRGNEVGLPAEHVPTGCLASIRDWDMQQLGVLQLRAIGLGRFRVRERRVAANGLIRASADDLPDDPRVAPADEHADCVTLLMRIVADLEQREPAADKRMIAQPYDFESAAWVANRLCEFLPIGTTAKQMLMELDEPLARLSLVRQFLRQQRVL